MTPSLRAGAILALALCQPAVAKHRTVPTAPFADYHQHLVSPAFAAIVNFPTFDGAALLKKLDEAGVRKAVVLSMGYSLADERKKLSDPDRRTREENDWTSGQVARSNGRLIGFCGVNPLRGEALTEIKRCLGLPGMKGVKLHLGNSGILLRKPAHLERMQALFSMIGNARAPVLVHMRARGGENYGAPDAQIFIDSLLPLVPHSDVIVAHFAGAGPGYPEQADEVMAVFGDAAERGDKRLRRTYFDIATILTAASTQKDGQAIAKRIRQVGPKHVLYGSDLLAPGSPSILEAWGYLTSKVGLLPNDLRTIAANKLPFMR